MAIRNRMLGALAAGAQSGAQASSLQQKLGKMGGGPVPLSLTDVPPDDSTATDDLGPPALGLSPDPQQQTAGGPMTIEQLIQQLLQGRPA